MPRTAIDALFDQADMRCTRCGQRSGTCSCWEPCRCGWTKAVKEPCGNPIHGAEDAANQAAEFIAASVISHMRSMYPEPMRTASGGFAKTLRAAIQREAQAMVLEILTSDPNDERFPHAATLPSPPGNR